MKDMLCYNVMYATHAYITREEAQLLGNEPRTFKTKTSPRIVEGVFVIECQLFSQNKCPRKEARKQLFRSEDLKLGFLTYSPNNV